ncbi:hypothetical protein [Cupriavidus metallidurans]|uniref:hypothetical protein n=1 Tax=Cupriavidus metallidurans TaxID=119219 RepID=UPI0039AFDC4E
MKLKVVGIDPSLKNFGFAIGTIDVETLAVEVQGLVLAKTEPDKKSAKVVRKNSDDLERARILHTALQEHCRDADLAIAEVPVGSQSARAMASYGVCVGVLSSCPIPLIQVTAFEVKLAGFGNKYATKEEMIGWATQAYPVAPWLTVKRAGKLEFTAANEHLADAVAAIHAGIKTDQFQQVLAMHRAMLRRVA